MEDDLCVELILSDNELVKLENLNKEFDLYKGIVPLSRFRMFIFADEAQLKTTCTNIQVTTAFILNDICVTQTLQKFDRLNLPKNSTQYEMKYQEFNKYLGAMAFLRYKSKGDELNLAFFKYLDFFIDKNKKLPFKEFDELKEVLDKKLTEDRVREWAKNKGLDYKEKDLNKDFKQDDERLDILAQIWLYCGEDKRKNLVDLLQVKSFKFFNETKLYFALGYYVGYSNFSKSELNKKLKFEFNKFDLKIIEAVYSFVFNDRQMNDDICLYINESKIFTEHFGTLLFDKNNDERQMFISLYNNAVSFIREKCLGVQDDLSNEIQNIKSQLKNLYDKIQVIQNQFDELKKKDFLHHNGIKQDEFDELKKELEQLKKELESLKPKQKKPKEKNEQENLFKDEDEKND